MAVSVDGLRWHPLQSGYNEDFVDAARMRNSGVYGFYLPHKVRVGVFVEARDGPTLEVTFDQFKGFARIARELLIASFDERDADLDQAMEQMSALFPARTAPLEMSDRSLVSTRVFRSCVFSAPPTDTSDRRI